MTVGSIQYTKQQKKVFLPLASESSHFKTHVTYSNFFCEYLGKAFSKMSESGFSKQVTTSSDEGRATGDPSQHF